MNESKMAEFVATVLALIAANYPDRKVRTVAVVLDDSTVVKLPVPAMVYFVPADKREELTDVEEQVLKYLKGRKDRLAAKEIHAGMERDGLGLASSTVERALARLRTLGYVSNIVGQGYAVAEV